MFQKRDKKVAVIGLGYIGLPTSALLASKGYKVVGVDVKKEVVETINRGEIHIVEVDLGQYVTSAVSDGYLRAQTELEPADVYIICVPTPFHKKGQIPTPNIDYVVSAAKSIARHIKTGDLVILESTCPVGTTSIIMQVLLESGADVNEICVAYCPERVLPGSVMREIVENNRVVGGVDTKSTKVISDFYRTFVKGTILETDSKTAEMCKLTENSYRDVNIAFANELSMICEANGVDVWELIETANQHPRVNILQPATGVGGHCIAVDPWFIVSQDFENAKLIRSAREVNNSKPNWVAEKIKLAVEKCESNKPKIACLGLAFKPDIDDLRSSPAIEVVEKLLEFGFNVLAVEPNIRSHNCFSLYSLDIALRDADMIAVLVGHKEFREDETKKLLQDRQALDFCGALI